MSLELVVTAAKKMRTHLSIVVDDNRDAITSTCRHEDIYLF